MGFAPDKPDATLTRRGPWMFDSTAELLLTVLAVLSITINVVGFLVLIFMKRRR